MGIALCYKSKNPYVSGARWATFFALGTMTIIRHHYWYVTVLENFIRLRDLENPLPWNELLCVGDTYSKWLVGVTGLLVPLFYLIVMRWDDWSGRWEMLRRGFFSSSLGMQAMIVVTVVYPTPLTMVLALSFAALISPIIRRQIRLNHVIFLLLPPMFAFSVPDISLYTTLIFGVLFLVFGTVERSLPKWIASFTVACGWVFLGVGISMLEGRALELTSGAAAGFVSLAFFLSILALSFTMIFKGERVTETTRNLFLSVTPKAVRDSSWWDIRELWVNQEVDARENRRYDFRTMKFTIGMFFFGPKEFPVESESAPNPAFPKVNYTASVLALMLFGTWIMMDAVLNFADMSNLTYTYSLFLVGFAAVLSVPVTLLVQQVRADKKAVVSMLSSISAIGVFALIGLGTLWYGINGADRLQDTTPTPPVSNEVVEYECPCIDDPIDLGRYLSKA